MFRESPTAKLPTKSRDSDHCFDFYASEAVTIHNGETVIVPTGIHLELPKGYGLILKERSGLASKGVMVGAGVIDEEYRGLIGVVLRYLNPIDPDSTYHIKVGDKIVQGKLEKTIRADIKEVPAEKFNTNTSRGTSGFGASGR